VLLALPAAAMAAATDVIFRHGFDSANLCAPDPASTLVVNVRDAPYAARGDGIADDTHAIQRALDAVAGTGGTVLVPAGTYLIDPTASSSGGNHGLSPGGNTTLQLSQGAVLKAIGTSAGTYAVVQVHGVSDVNIVGGGTIEGERAAHTGTGGEWGMAIDIGNARRVAIDHVTVREAWGDGIYIGNAASSQITICRVTADHNRRQGMSITNASGVSVTASVFANTAGTAPENGIDIEPNAGEAVHDVAIQNCTFANNAGGAFQTGVPVALGGSATVDGVVFDHNTLSGNGANAIDGSYHANLRVSNSDGTQATDNVLTDNVGQGIVLTNDATHTEVSGNRVQGTRQLAGSESATGVGILIGAAAGSRVTGNTVTGNQGHGIWQVVPDASVTIADNLVAGNGLTP